MFWSIERSLSPPQFVVAILPETWPNCFSVTTDIFSPTKLSFRLANFRTSLRRPLCFLLKWSLFFIHISNWSADLAGHGHINPPVRRRSNGFFQQGESFTLSILVVRGLMVIETSCKKLAQSFAPQKMKLQLVQMCLYSRQILFALFLGHYGIFHTHVSPFWPSRTQITHTKASSMEDGI